MRTITITFKEEGELVRTGIDWGDPKKGSTNENLEVRFFQAALRKIYMGRAVGFGISDESPEDAHIKAVIDKITRN